MNGRRASVSTNKVYGIANSSYSSSYMPTQSITEYLIIKRPLPASSVFSPLLPVFYIVFLLFQKWPPVQQYLISAQSSPYLHIPLPEDSS